MRAPLVVVLAVVAMSLQPSLALATEAEDLFEQGRAALRENKLDLACDLLRKSETLDPAPGTLLNLADCEERRGNRVLAHGLFVKVGAHVEPLFSTEGKKRAATLEAQLSKITLRIEGPLPRNARLTVDGVETSADTTVVVEPGPHQAVLTAPSLPSDDTKRLITGAGQAVEVVFTLAAKGPEPTKAEPGFPGLGVAGLLIGGAGVVSLGAAIGTGVAMLGIGECFPDEPSTSLDAGCDRSEAAADEGRSLEAASTALFVVGGVLTATGVVLLAVTPWGEAGEAGSASIGLGLDHVRLRLSF